MCLGQVGTYFKVLGCARRGGFSQISLLEIPEDIAGEFAPEALGPLERTFAADAEENFASALLQPPRPEHATRIWLERLTNPLGMLDDGTFYDLDNPWGKEAFAQLVAAGVVNPRKGT